MPSTVCTKTCPAAGAMELQLEPDFAQLVLDLHLTARRVSDLDVCQRQVRFLVSDVRVRIEMRVLRLLLDILALALPVSLRRCISWRRQELVQDPVVKRFVQQYSGFLNIDLKCFIESVIEGELDPEEGDVWLLANIPSQSAG